jgi:hypothetical protein
MHMYKTSEHSRLHPVPELETGISRLIIDYSGILGRYT